jgi:hypothetical protein
LSRSSGQVTHVLLTRSRLCPGPKPGSSLHLHVLGTPPAFVLSQDQTLREELHKESSGKDDRRRRRRTMPTTATITSWVHPWWDETLAPTALPLRVHVWSGGARRGQSWHRRLWMPRRTPGIDGVEPGHTILDRLLDRRVCMLLSFQRPPHRLRRVSSSEMQSGAIPTGSRPGR